MASRKDAAYNNPFIFRDALIRDLKADDGKKARALAEKLTNALIDDKITFPNFLAGLKLLMERVEGQPIQNIVNEVTTFSPRKVNEE